MKIWTVANQKGGVGKTTSAVSLGGLLAEQGERVLLIDLDPQGSLTAYFGYNPETISTSTLNLFSADKITRTQVHRLVRETSFPGLSLLPASIGLSTIERKAAQGGMGLKVTQALKQIWNDFDYVIIDSPPVLGTLMINALAACDQLLVPVQTEFLALKGMERMLRTVSMVTKSLRKQLPYTIIPTMFDQRTKASVLAFDSLRQQYAQYTWSSVIPVDTRFRDASRHSMTPSQYDNQSHGVLAYAKLLESLTIHSTAHDVSFRPQEGIVRVASYA
jgi:chromosome partitioning protein